MEVYEAPFVANLSKVDDEGLGSITIVDDSLVVGCVAVGFEELTVGHLSTIDCTVEQYTWVTAANGDNECAGVGEVGISEVVDVGVAPY